jgi:hypothetical protein
MGAISLCHSQPSGRPASCRQPLYTRNRQPIDEGSEVNSITRQTADRPPGTISTAPSAGRFSQVLHDSPLDGTGFEPSVPVYSELGPPIAAGCFWSVSFPDPLCGPALFGVDESSRAGVRARPLARPLWLGRRLGDDGRHTFGIDVESEEGQRLVAGVAPLVDEAEGLVDQ